MYLGEGQGEARVECCGFQIEGAIIERVMVEGAMMERAMMEGAMMEGWPPSIMASSGLAE